MNDFTMSVAAHLLLKCAELLPVLVQYAFNLFSHNAPMQENGYNEEEMKMVKETHKIWRNPGVAITATCIRVPVMRAHAESINLELENELSEDDVSPAYCTLSHMHVWNPESSILGAKSLSAALHAPIALCVCLPLVPAMLEPTSLQLASVSQVHV